MNPKLEKNKGKILNCRYSRGYTFQKIDLVTMNKIPLKGLNPQKPSLCLSNVDKRNELCKIWKQKQGSYEAYNNQD